jgi:chemotaxis protein MotB
MARLRRELRYATDIWPGFVDALSTLLLVIIFLLVVFVLGQFFLSQLLQGKDTKLASLETAVAELTRQLDLEESTTAELRLSVSQLSSDLQSAFADRDDTAALLAETESERDQFRDQLFLVQDEKAALTQTLDQLRQEAARAGDLQAELERTVDLRSRLEEELRRAQQTVATDKETIETQLAQLIQLRSDIAALQSTRDELELQVAEMTTLLQAAEAAKGDATKEIARLADLLEAAQARTAGLESEVARLDQSIGAAEQETRDLASEITRLTALLQSAREESAAAGQQVAALTAELESNAAERGDLAGEVERL